MSRVQRNGADDGRLEVLNPLAIVCKTLDRDGMDVGEDESRLAVWQCQIIKPPEMLTSAQAQREKRVGH